ncbi:MAG: hypothetical protein AAFQ43_03030 [Bacteroidota bacterium]
MHPSFPDAPVLPMRALPILLALLLASGASAQALCEADPDQHRAATRAPVLSEIASGDETAESTLHAYLCAYTPEALDSTPALLAALALRDSVISQVGARVEDWFFANEEQGYEQAEALYTETEALALQPVAAEGMIFNLAAAPLMDGVLTTLAPPDLIAYLDFMDARGASFSGEYPYMSLGEQIAMVQQGETLRRDYPSSPYVGETQEAFSEALLTLASLHPVLVEGMDDTWMVGVGTSEFYPWLADGEALATFLSESPGSRYAGPLASILADPPEAVAEGALDVIVLGDGYASRADAAARALAHLERGVDAVGPMQIDGSFYVVYRYYPAGDRRASVAYDRADAQGLRPASMTYTPEVY